MAGILPPPTEVAIGLGGWLDTTGLPDVFVGFEPLPAPPVDQPSDPTARAIAAVARASTFKVTAATCGLSSVGTGFVIANGYVVTNAHVVAGAGARGIRVSGTNGDVHDAIPVLVDPAFDIAVLLARDLYARPLTFASHDPERGDLGATLGYPGGGPLKILPAAVSSQYAATGHDIYSRDRIRRLILELRAEVDRGDSGGPLILAGRDGRRRRLRRGQDGPGGRLRAGRIGGRGPHQTGDRPDEGRRHRRLRRRPVTLP